MIRRRKKEGRWFFIPLLALSGVVIFTIYFSNGQASDAGKEEMISFYEKLSANSDFVKYLPEKYTAEQVKAVQTEVSDFFKATWSDQVNKKALYEISGQIEIMMDDHQILEDEVQSLLTLIRKRREMS